jgi:hypothetical protein
MNPLNRATLSYSGRARALPSWVDQYSRVASARIPDHDHVAMLIGGHIGSHERADAAVPRMSRRWLGVAVIGAIFYTVAGPTLIDVNRRRWLRPGQAGLGRLAA